MRAAVLGSPIAHSLSPALHRAAYELLGLDDWTYDAVECTEAELAAFVAGLGPDWAVTMMGLVFGLGHVGLGTALLIVERRERNALRLHRDVA